MLIGSGVMPGCICFSTVCAQQRGGEAECLVNVSEACGRNLSPFTYAAELGTVAATLLIKLEVVVAVRSCCRLVLTGRSQSPDAFVVGLADLCGRQRARRALDELHAKVRLQFRYKLRGLTAAGSKAFGCCCRKASGSEHGDKHAVTVKPLHLTELSLVYLACGMRFDAVHQARHELPLEQSTRLHLV